MVVHCRSSDLNELKTKLPAATFAPANRDNPDLVLQSSSRDKFVQLQLDSRHCCCMFTAKRRFEIVTHSGGLSSFKKATLERT
ncbi:hypothetical protein TMatcc_006106 [Talaromyces marneffei ATCC 18224]|uniref:uncharacterized protein n=1 Tax=Talaromyces marneffei TaxID=37727 RepID=UPI0012A7FE9B|nr:uncharacterized protein EYB26_002924 [Talaromyces marneffei]QGA15267.1 hypothetical protein EYB26_002924 [Talaromyces marneffei]